jgi:hypothetical protein
VRKAQAMQKEELWLLRGGTRGLLYWLYCGKKRVCKAQATRRVGL